MARTLRHVTIPDHHNRIPLVGEAAKAKIAAASTPELQEAIDLLASQLILADEHWMVWYPIEDELRDRGQWHR
ncbi:hypothetical protein [Microbispora sp. NPDC049125]|uniref:hypothetical protein n=1 Tax=Microbispora sp. NPDC049125 TaxID=3154929 RepID=UPI003467E884